MFLIKCVIKIKFDHWFIVRLRRIFKLRTGPSGRVIDTFEKSFNIFFCALNLKNFCLLLELTHPKAYNILILS